MANSVNPRSNALRLEVAVLGGSITGCAVAAELARAGCEVTVFERRGEEPKDRGAGIGLPPSLILTLLERELVDADLPYLEVHRFPHMTRDEDEERYGRVLWEQQASIALVNWAALYRSLRRRVPEGAYRAGGQVTALREHEDGRVAVDVDGDKTHEFDLVVCADGHRSLGRRTLFPESEAPYVGYLLWRGAVAEKELVDVAPLEGAVCWPTYAGGHGLFYLVPGLDGSVALGRRLVNWGMHLRVSHVGRAELLTGKNPPAYDGPLPSVREGRLKSWVRDVLPEFYAEIVERSEGTFVQMIHESTVPAYRRGRICLAGDAGALARPHTGTGALKGITDAITLAESLRAHSRLDDALATWSNEQTVFGNELVRLASQVARALASELPRSKRMDSESVQEWFSSVVTVPSEVFDA